VILKDGTVDEGIMKNGVKEGEWKTSINGDQLRTAKFAHGHEIQQSEQPDK
jgi:hypothetical protein